MMIKKREIDKFPYGSVEGLSENEARNNRSEARKTLLNVVKTYGPTVLRIALIVYLLPECALADGKPNSAPSSSPTPSNQASLQVLPATKELLGIGAVALTCAAAASNPVTAIGVAACIVVVLAKSAGKL